jgi:mono/diheme cytochrome c family protein
MTNRTSRAPWSALMLLVAALLATGCDTAAPPELTKAEPGKIPASPQRSGAIAAGRDALLNRAVLSCGLPYSAYVASSGNPVPTYDLPGRHGRNAELPYQLTAFVAKSGVELVTTNCLGCHAAPLNGELVIGLGNEFLDFTGDPVMRVEGVGAFVEGEPAATEWRRWADRISAVAPWSITDTIGANPAQALTLALMAHRDPKTLAWSDEPVLPPPSTRVPPVSVPPLWNVDKKHAVFYNGEGRGDHVRYMILASTTCTDSVAEAREIDAWFTDVRAYLASLPSPAYPYPIDQGLAADGERLFNANCRKCHGRYGERETYPNKLVALDKVGTDPEMAEKAYHKADRFIRWFNGSFYGSRYGGVAETRATPALGYVAPPLDGAWATAPYLHNGSVPTLAALLDTSARPVYWRFAGAEPDYDPEALGWDHLDLDAGQDQYASIDEQKWVYDTTRPGYGNQGHDFGDEMSADERRALLEYLKAL